jgi:menaquinone reductase, multiheme cytochrome c subunit
MNVKPMFVFPKWTNKVVAGVLLVLVIAPLYVGALLGYGANPVTLAVGYEPIQPVPYSHALHAGKLGIDCRYCHNTVEKAGFAAIPPSETCMNCHSAIWTKSDKLKPVRESFASGNAVPWIKVHDEPDYVYFNHSAHVNVGVSCVECHGQVNHMDVVRQVQPMNMAWCIECHRNPDKHLRPRNQVTNLDWSPEQAEKDIGKLPDGETLASFLKKQYHVNPNTDCVTCHR